MKKKITGIRDVATEEKVAFLSQPAAYPHQAGNVLVKETHMSWVFLVNGFVYKMKKPVSYDLFDHRDLESRYTNCKEEVRINRVLAKDIYLGIVSLVINQQGKLQLEGNGEEIEWLVKMKRIPEANMLDYAIVHHSLNETNLRLTAVLLARYYQTADHVILSSEQYQQKLEEEINKIYVQLTAPLYALTPDLLKNLHRNLLLFLHTRRSLFQERAFKNKIIDAHGDLRPEHVCLKPRPAIIDRLEFSKALRRMDPAEELAYLSIECELLGNRGVGELFFAEYSNCTNDYLHARLIKFYKAKKAFERAYLVVRHMNEEQYKQDPKWGLKAKAYLSLSENYLYRLTI